MYRFHIRLLIALFLAAGSLSAPAFADINWQTDLNDSINIAKDSNRLVFLEVSAPWCPACRKLDKLMHDKKIVEFLEPHFISVKLDADSPQGQGIMKQYGAKGIPALFVFSPQGDLKGKMSGAPRDCTGFQHFVTNLAGGEAVVAAAGVANSSGRHGGTIDGAQHHGNFQNPGPGQSHQQQQQMPYPQGQPQGNYFQQQPATGYAQPQYQQQSANYGQPNYGQPQYQQPPANYGQPQFQQGQSQANYAQPQYQQPQYQQPQYQQQQSQPQYGYPAQQQQGQSYYPPNYQQGQPGAYSPPYQTRQPNGYSQGNAPMQNPYAGGAYPTGSGTQPGSAQNTPQRPPANQQSQ